MMPEAAGEHFLRDILKKERDDFALRPRSLDEFVGQERLKQNLKVFISASLLRKEPLDHVLFYGPPGLGKTTLAFIIAEELGREIRCFSGPTFSRAGDIASVLTSIGEGNVVFIDEIHRLPRPCEEVLYTAMEDFAIDVLVGKGPGARSIRLSLPPFTLVGATTRLSLISAPLRNRFGIIEKLDFYSQYELEMIIKNAANLLRLELKEEAVSEIARRSRGTPRIAKHLLRRVRDFADYYRKEEIDRVFVKRVFEALDIDELGLNWRDRSLLRVLKEKFGGGPAGLNNLATAVNEDILTLENFYEPYLIKLGLLARTARGRVLTSKGEQYLQGVYQNG